MFYQNLKISHKLVLAFCILSLIPLIIMGVITYSISVSSLKTQIFNDLTALAAAKRSHLVTYLEEKVRDASFLAGTAEILSAFRDFSRVYERNGHRTDSEEYRRTDAAYRQFLADFTVGFRFSDMLLICRHGNTVFSITGTDGRAVNLMTGPDGANELAGAYKKAMQTGTAVTSAYSEKEASGSSALYIVVPVIQAENTYGAIALMLDTRTLFAHALDYAGLGRTGEVVLAQAREGQAQFITPLRHDPTAAFTRTVPFGAPTAYPIQQAVQKKDGSGYSIDYRGADILAVWQYIPELAVGMVVKIDREEAFAGLNAMQRYIGMVVLVTVFLIAAGILVIARSVSRPLVRLRGDVLRFGKGDLDHRTEVTARDEIGELGAAFNRMTDELKATTASRDDLEKEIRARKTVDEERVRLISELDRKNRELEQIVYIASHDLRSPLVNLRGFSKELNLSLTELKALIPMQHVTGNDAVKAKTAMEEDIPEALDYIQTSVAKMEGLLNGLLLISRLGRAFIRPERLDMTAMLEEIRDTVAYRLQQAGVECTIGELPDCRGDRIQINQLFSNLLDNAIKYLDPARPGRITVTGKIVDGRSEYCVADNGIGIRPDHQTKIFELFHRLDPDATEGEGMGLSIVTRILEKHDGGIRVESEPGAGSRFYITLPQTAPPDTGRAQEADA